MKRITFATTNQGKIASLREAFDAVGLDDIVIDGRALDIIEPQADTCEEVAISKARQAFALLGQPVIVDDSSFHINCLGGFPGVYAKYMNETLGARGIVDFMRDKVDRSAYFSGALAYVDSEGREHIFSEAPYRGRITERVYEISDSKPWSELYKIFIPDGSEHVLGNMTEDDHRNSVARSNAPNKHVEFAKWLRKELAR